MRFAQYLKRERARLNMRHADLAKLLQVSTRTIYAWESDERRPKAPVENGVKFVLGTQPGDDEDPETAREEAADAEMRRGKES